MATGDLRVYAARAGSTLGATTIVSLCAFALRLRTTKSEDAGVAGSPGLADEVVVDRDLVVMAMLADYAEALGLLELTAANFVGQYKGEAGAAKKVTVKNVVFTDPPTEISVPAKDGGGRVSLFAITGRAHWGASDTWALMIVAGTGT